MLYEDGETLGSTRSEWWGINAGDVNVDVEGEFENQHTGTRRTMKVQAQKTSDSFQASSGEKDTRESAIPMDGEKAKEAVGTDRAVTKLLYHHFVLTQQRVLLPRVFDFFSFQDRGECVVLDWSVGR